MSMRLVARTIYCKSVARTRGDVCLVEVREEPAGPARQDHDT